MLYSPLPEGTYRITQSFGSRPSYYRKYGLKGHNGVDLAPLVPGSQGILVFAPHEGYVTIGNEGKTGYGQFVEILSLPYTTEGTRKKSTLAHLAEFLVNDGQFVGSGDVIGIMGTTGDSSGIHVHWTYKRADSDGNSLDKDNGYKGAISIAPFTLCWSLRKLGE